MTLLSLPRAARQPAARLDVPVEPIPLWGSAAAFGVPTLAMWVATRHAIPWLNERLPGPDILGWFIAGSAVFAALFLAALLGYWMETDQPSLGSLAARFRFGRLSGWDVAASLAVLILCGMLSAGILFAWRLASDAWSLSLPQVAPSFIHLEPVTSDTRWILLAWLPLFFFNIAGEELWWRGYLLPRQQAAHGRAAYLVHAAGLALFHLPLGIDLTIILIPYLFALPAIVGQRRNLWTGFLLHGLLNGGGFLAVAFGFSP